MSGADADGQFVRQLATIVSADAVGFSRHMEQDAEAAVAALEERRRIIIDSGLSGGGMPFGIAGDSLMIEFGTPSRAFAAAAEAQKRIEELNRVVPPARRMAFRVGLNTGDVIVRGESRYGDDVNIAARMQEMAAPGGIVVSETTWSHIHGLVAADFIDLGARRLKNLSYPMRAFAVSAGADRKAPSPLPRGEAAFDEPGSGGLPAVAVLSFATRGSDRTLDAIADGVSDDLIAGLSAMRWLPVISGRSSTQLDTAMGAAAAGRALGARYVVEGQVELSNEDLDVRFSLEDAVRRRVLWSARFVLPARRAETAAREFGPEVAAALRREVGDGAMARDFHLAAETPDGWHLLRRGRWHLARQSRQDTATALDLFTRAADADAGPAPLNEIAWWHFWRSWRDYGRGGAYRDDLERVIELSRRVVALDPDDARPHCHLGIADIMLARPRAAIDHLERALCINPSYAFAHSALGSARLLLGQARESMPCFVEAERLSPFDLYRFHNLGELAAAHAFVEDWPGAIDIARQSLRLAPSYWYARVVLIGALARAGDIAAARAELATLRLRNPDFDPLQIDMVPFADKASNRYLADNFQLARRAASTG